MRNELEHDINMNMTPKNEQKKETKKFNNLNVNCMNCIDISFLKNNSLQINLKQSYLCIFIIYNFYYI